MSEEEEGKQSDSPEEHSYYGEISRLSSKVEELAREKEDMDRKIRDLEERMVGMSVITYHHSVEKRTTQMKWGEQQSQGGIRIQKVRDPKSIHDSFHSKSDSFDITPLSEDECPKQEDSHDRHTTRNFPYAPSISAEIEQGARDKDHGTRGYDDSRGALVVVGQFSQLNIRKDDRRKDDGLIEIVLEYPSNKETTDTDGNIRNYGGNKLHNENMDSTYSSPGDRENANKHSKHATRFNLDDDNDEDDDDEDNRLRAMPSGAAIQRMQSRYDAAAIHKKQAKHGQDSRTYAKKEGIDRSDGRFRQDCDDMGNAIPGPGKRDYTTSQGNKDYPIGQGNRDYYPVGLNDKDYPIDGDYPVGQVNRDDYPTGKDRRDYPPDQGTRDYPLGQDTRHYPPEHGTKDYPIGQGSNDYPIGQDCKDYSQDQGSRDYPVSLDCQDIPRKEDINRNDNRFNQEDDDMDGAIPCKKEFPDDGQSNKDFLVDLDCKDIPRKEGIHRNDNRFNQDDDMGRATPSFERVQRIPHKQDKENVSRDDAASKMDEGLETDDSKSEYSDHKAGGKCMCLKMMKDDEDWKASVTILLELLVINAYSEKFPQSLIGTLIDPSKRDTAVSETISKMNSQVSPDCNRPITRMRTHPRSASTKDSSVVLVRANSRGLTIDGSKVKDHTTPGRTRAESKSNVMIGEGKRPSPFQSSQNRDKQIISPGRKDNATTAKVSPASHSSAGTDVKTPARHCPDLNQNKENQITPTGKMLYRYPTSSSQNKDKQPTPVGLRENDGSAVPKVFSEFPPYPSPLFDAKDPPVPSSSRSNDKLSNSHLCQLVSPNTYVCPAPDKIDIICPPGSNPVIHIPSTSKSDTKNKKDNKSVTVACCEPGKPCTNHK